MIHAFPVVSRFICEPNTYRPSEEFIKRVTHAFTSMKFSLSKDKTLDPISWVMKKQNNGLGTDIMYKLIREKVIKKILRSEISGIEGIDTSKDLAQKWVQLIENRFFYQARVERNKYGSRLMISRELPVLDSYAIRMASRQTIRMLTRNLSGFSSTMVPPTGCSLRCRICFLTPIVCRILRMATQRRIRGFFASFRPNFS